MIEIIKITRSNEPKTTATIKSELFDGLVGGSVFISVDVAVGVISSVVPSDVIKSVVCSRFVDPCSEDIAVNVGNVE